MARRLSPSPGSRRRGVTYGIRVCSRAGASHRVAGDPPGRLVRRDAPTRSGEATGVGPQGIRAGGARTLERVVGVYAAPLDDAVVRRDRRTRLGVIARASRRSRGGTRDGARSERAKLQAARDGRSCERGVDRDLDALELKRLIGWPGSAPLRLAGDPDAVLPELQSTENLSAARTSDPVLKSLAREVQILGQSARLESKRWAPIIEASATYQRLAKFNDYDKYTVVRRTPSRARLGPVSSLTGGRFEDGRRGPARLEHSEASSRAGSIWAGVRRAGPSCARARRAESEPALAGLPPRIGHARSSPSKGARAWAVDEGEMSLATPTRGRGAKWRRCSRVRLLSLRATRDALLGPNAVRLLSRQAWRTSPFGRATSGDLGVPAHRSAKGRALSPRPRRVSLRRVPSSVDRPRDGGGVTGADQNSRRAETRLELTPTSRAHAAAWLDGGGRPPRTTRVQEILARL